MHKCHFGATEIDFFGGTITSEGVKPQKESQISCKKKTKFPKSKKALQRYIGFFNYYRDYISGLSEKLVPFFQLLEKDEKVLFTIELVEQFNEINRDLDRCSQLISLVRRLFLNLKAYLEVPLQIELYLPSIQVAKACVTSGRCLSCTSCGTTLETVLEYQTTN